MVKAKGSWVTLDTPAQKTVIEVFLRNPHPQPLFRHAKHRKSTKLSKHIWSLKDVRAHCYCASLVRTLFVRHVLATSCIQARAPSRNSTKYRADDLCVNLVCEYFCWMFGDPHFFLGRSVPFLILSIILKNKRNLYVESFNYFSYVVQIRSNWYMDRGVRDLEVAFFNTNCT